jgi:four helix bundle protein
MSNVAIRFENLNQLDHIGRIQQVKKEGAKMAYRSFEELDIWKRACRLAVRTYEILKDCRDYGLKDQMTPAVVSIASNIAEGAERNSKTEYIRYLHIAKGSSAKLRTQVYIAQQIGIYPDTQAAEFIAELKEISAMLHGLIKSLSR